MLMEEQIKVRIQKAFQPEYLKVINESAKHKGHQGDDGSGQTHFSLKVVSHCFMGMSRIERQRAVNENIKNLFSQGLHAISITALTPEEGNK